MGFYSPATIVKDAQRHGLKITPIDVIKSDWLCTVEQLSVADCQLPVEHSAISIQHSIDGVHRQVSRNSKLETRNFTGHRPLTTGHLPATVRLGLRYVKGLREEAARAIVRERSQRPFTSIDDLARRVPELRKNELVTLAQIGALNSVSSFEFQFSSRENSDSNSAFSSLARPQPAANPVASATGADPVKNPVETQSAGKLETRNLKLETGHSPLPTAHSHRRDALWQVERAARPAGALLQGIAEPDSASPLARMNNEERLVADFRGTGLTVGRHPMAYRRLQLRGVLRACDLQNIKNGRRVRVAGSVIARQRPGTAHGFVFLSLEDETGIANAIITPDLFEKNRLLLIREQFLLIEGTLQNLDHVLSVKANRVLPLQVSSAEIASHDFH
jgi:DNA polymerase III alpha subunit